MQHYFTHISITFACKNSLEKAIYDALHQLDRALVPETEIESFKTGVLQMIEKKNQDFPRCKPVKAEWWNPGNQLGEVTDWRLQLPGILSFTAYKQLR